MSGQSSRASMTFLPFLYPSLLRRAGARAVPVCRYARWYSSNGDGGANTHSKVNNLPESRLNPRPDDYGATNFADKATITLYAGRGGNGCVSFLREMFLPDGPPNGGDGGTGGNIYIQAAHGETSLHKLARKRFVRAGKGIHGQGSARSGTRGDDVIITVPVGTIVKEVERNDPAAEEQAEFRVFRAAQRQRKKRERIAAEEEKQRLKKEEKARAAEKAAMIERGEITVEDLEREIRGEDVEKGMEEELEEYEEEEEVEEYEEENERRSNYVEEEPDPDADDPQRSKWLMYPGMSKTDMKSAEFPRLPRRDRLLQQPPAPIYLDLSKPTEKPFLLAAGAVGGLGNPHFASRAHPRPVFATKGDEAITMKIELELKLLADVGLVGLPNAGKSTLLRAITNSRTRVGSWAFTTLQPNIGTVVLDKYSGRPVVNPKPAMTAEEDVSTRGARTRFTIADIPGLIEGAHLDKGLGIAFLRHVERAGVLAFVIDLSAGDAVAALKSLWREVGLYARMREEEERDREMDAMIERDMEGEDSPGSGHRPQHINLSNLDETTAPAPGVSQPAKEIAGKPWFVVATKADLPETKERFKELKEYLAKVKAGEEGHPAGVEDGWVKNVAAVPVSAINGQGVDRIVHWVAGLLDE